MDVIMYSRKGDLNSWQRSFKEMKLIFLIICVIPMIFFPVKSMNNLKYLYVSEADSALKKHWMAVARARTQRSSLNSDIPITSLLDKQYRQHK